MNVTGIRKEIRELRNSLLCKYEPVCKAFVLGVEDSLNEEEIATYREAHPHTRVLVLYRRNCGSGSSE